MTIEKEIIVALCALAGIIATALLTYLAAVRNAARQVRAQKEAAADAKAQEMVKLLASVDKQATDSGRALYQELSQEQQKRITQQHNDLIAQNETIHGLVTDVGLLRGQLTQAQADMATTRRELELTRAELRKTQAELRDTRQLLAETKEELVASRERQGELETEADALRDRVKVLEAELAKYRCVH